MIKNCTGKTLLKIRRVGGDFEIRIMDLKGKVLFQEWYQMKKPHKETYQKIIKIFEKLKDLII